MPEHPIWKTLHVAVYGMLCLGFAALFCSEFNATEWKQFFAVVGSGVVYEFVIRRNR